ncbi:recombinase family protein [Brevibacterium casei]|nr:recombinase family protein [Brevibacterium casei]
MELSGQAGIYCRISDDKAGGGLGVQRQEQDCRKLADRLNLPVVETYVDNDTSAYSGAKRHAYDRMVDDVRRGRITTVLAWHNDRPHRSPKSSKPSSTSSTTPAHKSTSSPPASSTSRPRPAG